MDKQTATNHIHIRLQAGVGRDEIVDELSQALKAPPKITERFVDQVISNHSQVPQSDKIQGDSLDKIEPLPRQANIPKEKMPISFGNGELPPGLLALISESDPNIDVLQKEVEPVGNIEIPLPRQVEFDAPVVNDRSKKIDLERLGEFVFQQLKKQHRHNDIVEAVCNQTGWHWNKSQRMVARVQTRRTDELQSGKNRVIIAIGIGIIFAGLVMAINGASIISEYAKLVVLAENNPEVLLNIAPQGSFFGVTAIIIGIGMIIGGGFGIARSVSERGL